MEKRAIIFLIVSLLIIIAYPFLVEKYLIRGTKKAVEKKEEPPVSAPRPETVPKVSPQTSPLSQTMEEKEIIVETDLMKVKLSNKGGVIRGWELKKYTLGDGGRIQLLPMSEKIERIAPLSIYLEDQQGIRTMDGLHEVVGGDILLDRNRKTGSIEFLYQDPAEGRKIKKRLTFNNDTYQVGLDMEGLSGGYRIYLGTNFGMTGNNGTNFAGFVGPVSLIDNSVVKDNLKKMEGEVEHKGEVSWIALQEKYFISALIPKGNVKNALINKEGDNIVSAAIRIVGPGSPGRPDSFILYAGPKEYDGLRAINVNLEETIDFGWFIYGSWVFVRLIAKPLFYILRFFYYFTNNYGYAIILLTVLLKGLFVPLTHKSYKSMKAMQALQPKIQELQKKYKDDKERLNRELMEIYKKNKVNPVGGCLPMLLQIPFFIALYNILYTTIELRQAPFLLWIKDLSDKDPYYVLPIIMGITMVIQQKMQPTQMDPAQAKMMMFMPVVFTFLFLNFPSGLVLYWLTNNILTIGQQLITAKYLEAT